MASTGDLIAKLIQMGIMISVLVVFLYRRKKGYRGYEWLGGALVLGLIQGITEISFYAVGVIPNTEALAQIDGIPYALLLLSLLMHFHYFLGFSWYFLLGAFALIISYFTAFMMELGFHIQANAGVPVNEMTFSVIFFVYQLYIFTVCFVSSVIIYLQTRKSKIWPQTLTFALSFAVSEFTAITEIVQNYTSFEFYGAIGFGIAIFVILLLYVIWPTFVYVSPISIYNFMIVHKSGVTLFSVNYGRKGDIVKTVLAGGGITAFVSFFKEVTQIKEQSLKSVELEKSSMIIKEYKEIAGVIIAPRKMKLFENSIELFTKKFYERYHDTIQKFSGETEHYGTATDLLVRLFPYLQKEKLYLL